MRTSKVSQDTARAVNALSRSTRTRLRSFGHVEQAAPSNDDSITLEAATTTAEPSSPLSSPPSSSTSDYAEPSPLQSRKRKRQPTTRTKTTTTVKTEILAPDGEAIEQAPQPATIPRKARRQPAKHIKSEHGTIQVEPPPNWEQMYTITAEMRKLVLAPVDTMGCESLADTSRSPIDQRLQTLVALMLSSQTKDTVTSVAMKNLQDNLPGGFTLSSLLTVEPALLNQLIEKVGFHNNKTKFIKATAEILRNRFGGDIPDTIEGLVSLPGVGPKMAYLTMSAAWGRDEGIGVDVHVHRITNLWGWHKTRTPEETRAQLEAWLPRDKWHAINHLLVGFGQTICLPVGRKCGECRLADGGLCPSAVVKKEVTKRIKREVIKREEGIVKTETGVEEVVQIKTEKADECAPPLDMLPQAPAQMVADIEGLGAGSRRSLRRLAT